MLIELKAGGSRRIKQEQELVFKSRVVTRLPFKNNTIESELRWGRRASKFD